MRTSTSSRGIAFGIGVAAALIVGTVVVGRFQTTSTQLPDRQTQPAKEARGSAAGLPPGGPLLYRGGRVSLAEAETRAGFTLHFPDHPLASSSEISEVWYRSPPEPTVAVRYLTGIVVENMLDKPPGRGVDPTDPEVIADAANSARNLEELIQRMAEEAAEYHKAPVSDFLATVNGRKALVFPYRPGNNPGSVMFSLPDDVVVSVFGDVDTAVLLTIARSVT